MRIVRLYEQATLKRSPLVWVLGALLLLQIADLPWTAEAPAAIPRLSDFSGPAISALGATTLAPVCPSLPAPLWSALILVFLVLVGFNLAGKTRPLGAAVILSGFLALLFLVLWATFDPCREAAWFPFRLLESGLVLLAIMLALRGTPLPFPSDTPLQKERLF
jgi:hypothetical protein